VGFRPHVYRLASRLGLGGFVLNSTKGVTIEVEGPLEAVEEFVTELRRRPPRLARITALEEESLPVRGESEFVIVVSREEGARTTLVSPDISICEACRREFFDPTDRRFAYPFINCTDCGPRYTIIESLPYDRPLTSMKVFEMCPDCRSEYDDPADRRFHAQPNACPACGPRAWLEDTRGRVLARTGGAGRPEHRDPWTSFRCLVKDGAVVAVKGLGGFHLACDACSEEAVERLRTRKRRPAKPLAVMAPDLDAARRYVEIGPEAEALLLSPAAPIVVLPARSVNPLLAPGARTLGLMLAYTPLHLLLFDEDLDLLVMTSANPSGLPIVCDNDAAREDLADIVDYFLFHDRDIVNRCEDSVIRLAAAEAVGPADHAERAVGGTDADDAPDDSRPADPAASGVRSGLVIPYRRSRGYAPAPLHVGTSLPSERGPTAAAGVVLGAGAEMKSTFCLLRGREAFLSPHLGEMDYVESLRAYRETLDRYARLLDTTPTVVAFDPHPGYNSSRLARRLAEGSARAVPVYHHHAHLVSCLADNGLPGDEQVLGLICDGTGYGSDEAIWGFELMSGTAREFRRLGHLAYTAMPGGDAAARHPYRAAVAHLYRALGPDGAGRLAALYPERRTEVELTLSLLKRGRAGAGGALVRTSSCGRLFDAVAALAGVCGENTYEGQAAVELTELLEPGKAGRGEALTYMAPPPNFRLDVIAGKAGHGDGKDSALTIDPAPFFAAVLDEVEADRAAGRRPDARRISLAFHQALTEAAVRALKIARERTGLERICLSGGTFQNPFLVCWLQDELSRLGFEVFIHRRVPPNDGGISLGQAVSAAWQAR